VPPGASGSSKINAKLSVPAGGFVQVNLGEVFSPSQEWLAGIGSPCRKAELVSLKSDSSIVGFSSIVGAADGPSVGSI
jgi:hypothetical protein